MPDRHRPRYHFLPPANWMNDPNGLIHWNGVYHLFYQYNPQGAWWGDIHWGHATSRDLVQWAQEPLALSPRAGTPDADGCWSGCLVNDAGTPTILYTGSAGGREHTCLATGSADLRQWQPFAGNPVIAAPPAELDVVGFRDPYVWREGDVWLMALGSGLRDVGGAVLLYRSRDLRAWEYLHPLCVGEAALDGTMWECPSFFALGDAHILIVSVIPTREVVAYIGSYADGRFIPERRQLLDGGKSFYAPQVFEDEGGRTLCFGWLAEERSAAEQRAAGWSGALALPRVLTLTRDGWLSMAPAPEIEALTNTGALPSFHLRSADAPITVPSDKGTMRTTCAVDAPMTTLTLAHPDLDAALTYRHTAGWLALTRDDAAPREIAVPLADDEALEVQIFWDASIIEICANERAWLTLRWYPTSDAPFTLSIE